VRFQTVTSANFHTLPYLTEISALRETAILRTRESGSAKPGCGKTPDHQISILDHDFMALK
jgi:hypothetical protein